MQAASEPPGQPEGGGAGVGVLGGGAGGGVGEAGVGAGTGPMFALAASIFT